MAKKDISPRRWQKLAGLIKEDRENWGDMDPSYPYDHEHDYDDQAGIAQSEISGEAQERLDDDLVEDLVNRAKEYHWSQLSSGEKAKGPDTTAIKFEDLADHAWDVLSDAIEESHTEGTDMSEYMDDDGSPSEEAIKELSEKAHAKIMNDAFNKSVGESLDDGGFV